MFSLFSEHYFFPEIRNLTSFLREQYRFKTTPQAPRRLLN